MVQLNRRMAIGGFRGYSLRRERRTRDSLETTQAPPRRISVIPLRHLRHSLAKNRKIENRKSRNGEFAGNPFYHIVGLR